MTYPQAVRYLLSLGNEGTGGRLGLDRIEKLLERLGHPERSFRAVHIAGTNGKGSTAAMIESGLRAGGMRAGLYTSPHLVRINERIRALGREISDAELCGGFAAVRDAVEQLLAEGAVDCHPSYFECVTALGFEHFRRAGVEIAVVEVGLGGRLDATNVVRTAVSVITPIDFDHEAFLGKTAASISAEKAGILKPGVPAVFAPQRVEARDTLDARAQALGIEVVRAGQDWRAEQIGHQDGCYRFAALHRSGKRISARLELAGEHQVTNALTAIAALDLLGIEPGAIEDGLREARWPGRLEAMARDPLVLLDGAHNPAGARVLARYIEQHLAGRRVWLIYAAMRDKAVDEVAGILFPAAHQVLLTQVGQPRALSARALQAIAGHHHPRTEVTGSLQEALGRARAGASGDDVILIAGSLFLVGEAKSVA